VHCLIPSIMPASHHTLRMLSLARSVSSTLSVSCVPLFTVRDTMFFDCRALDMVKAQERTVETIFFREDLRRVSYDDVGRIYESPRVGEAYSDAFLSEVAHRKEITDAKPKIVVNYSHGTAAQFLPQLLNRLGIEVVA